MSRTAPIQPYTLKELAGLYGVNRRTMRTWLNKVAELGDHGYLFTVKQVQKIFDHLGAPEKTDGKHAAD